MPESNLDRNKAAILNGTAMKTPAPKNPIGLPLGEKAVINNKCLTIKTSENSAVVVDYKYKYGSTPDLSASIKAKI